MIAQTQPAHQTQLDQLCINTIRTLLIDAVQQAKRNYDWPEEAKFWVLDVVQAHFQENLGQRGQRLRQEWMQTFEEHSVKYPELADQLYKQNSH